MKTRKFHLQHIKYTKGAFALLFARGSIQTTEIPDAFLLMYIKNILIALWVSLSDRKYGAYSASNWLHIHAAPSRSSRATLFVFAKMSILWPFPPILRNSNAFYPKNCCWASLELKYTILTWNSTINSGIWKINLLVVKTLLWYPLDLLIPKTLSFLPKLSCSLAHMTSQHMFGPKISRRMESWLFMAM